MPWKTKRQAAWGNSESGKRKLGPARVAEYNAATDFARLSTRRTAKARTRKKRKGPKVARLSP